MTKSFHDCDKCQPRNEEYTVLFRMRNPNDSTKGEMYSDNLNAWVNVSQHESMCDLIDTIVHESIHVAMKREYMNDDAEHTIIKYKGLANEDWL